jgi:hypothetical protein
MFVASSLKHSQSLSLKRKYNRPTLTRVKIDADISMVMMSPFGPGSDPEAGIFKSLSPLKWLR